MVVVGVYLSGDHRVMMVEKNGSLLICLHSGL